MVCSNPEAWKYDASFKDTQYTFSAMVFETLGAVNVEGEEVLRQLFRFAARLGREIHFLLRPSLGTNFVQSATVCFASYFESY